MNIFLLELETPGPEWAPFGNAAPLSELRAGMWRLRERWEQALGGKSAGVVAPHLAGHVVIGGPAMVSAADIVGPAWVVEPTFAVRIPMRPAGGAKRLMHGGKTVAWRLDPGQRWEGPFTSGDGVVIEGRRLVGAFDLITALEQLLFTDTVASLGAAGDPIPDGTIVFGNADAIALRGAELEPGVVLDARKGAIILQRGVQVRHGTRIEGPFWAGDNTMLLGGQMRQSSIGPHCRVHGELSTSVFNGFANKSHDGFVGHSVIGEWVNLGAGTITSNLKNTYGPIRLDANGQLIDTQRANLGALFGDHAKTAIGTLLPTGAIIGAGANLFGEPRAAKYTAPFSWGGGDAALRVDEFVEAARRILPRRDVIVDARIEASLRALHARMSPPA